MCANKPRRYERLGINSYGHSALTGGKAVVSYTVPSNALLSQFSYFYDSAGEITQWQQYQNGDNKVYSLGYDQAGQLTGAQAGSGSVGPPYSRQNYYNYDSAANRTTAQSSSTQTARLAGTVTAGNTVTVTVSDAGLSG